VIAMRASSVASVARGDALARDLRHCVPVSRQRSMAALAASRKTGVDAGPPGRKSSGNSVFAGKRADLGGAESVGRAGFDADHDPLDPRGTDRGEMSAASRPSSVICTTGAKCPNW
jgi:hypothetical protein